KRYEDEDFQLGIVTFLESINHELQGAGERGIISALYRLKKNLKDVEHMDLLAAARDLRSMNSYVASYGDVVDKLALEVHDMRAEGLLVDPKLEELLTSAQKDINSVRHQYYDLGIQIFAPFLGFYTGNRNEKLPVGREKLDLIESLTNVDRDIPKIRAMIDSMAFMSDEVLQLFYHAVRSQQYKATLNSNLSIAALIEAKIKLEEAGVPNARWIYERDVEGTLTGNILSRYNLGEYERQLNIFADLINKEYGLPEDRFAKRDLYYGEEMPAIKAWYKENKDKAKIRDLERRLKSLESFAGDTDFFYHRLFQFVKENYKREWYERWYKIKTQPHPNLNEIIALKKKELTEDQFAEWYGGNVVESRDFAPKYTNELSVPANEFINPEYTSLTGAKKEFYDKIKAVLDTVNSYLPDRYRSEFRAPQLRKDFVERVVASGNFMETFKNITTLIGEGFSRTEDESEFGGVQVDEKGELARMVPILFTTPMKNKNLLSTDIVASMSHYIAMAENYNKISEISDMMEIGRDVIINRKMAVKPPKNREEAAKMARRKDSRGTNIEQILDAYMKMQVYGQMKADEGTFGRTNIDIAKTVDTLGRYVAINNLALNIYAGIANVGFGVISEAIEAVGKDFFSIKDLAIADKQYAQLLPTSLIQLGRRYQTSFLTLWAQRMQVMQDFKQSVREVDTERKTLFSKMFSLSSIFFIMHAGEHWLHLRTSLALANNTKVKDKNGKESTLFNAYEVRGNFLHLKPEFEGVITPRMEEEFMNKTNFLNHELHGIYNYENRSAAQMYSLWRLALMFRKFIVPGVNRRFKKAYYNVSAGQWVGGYYNTSLNFMNNFIKELVHTKFVLKDVRFWSAMTELEKHNFNRLLMEMTLMIGFAVLSAILTNLAGDDKDDWWLNMLAYQANRLFTETSFYWNPNSALQIVNSPAAAISLVSDFVNILGITAVSTWNEELQSGKYKGWKKGPRGLFTLVPMAGTLHDVLMPSERLKYFTSFRF
ncbi:hypothetical protein KKH23_07125, partial [Patescibacteria group bacterium]|nr:hypothetical protein [Patescibacteria group bacterium]